MTTHAPTEWAFPKEFACPITLHIMSECVLAEDGHTYDREAISHWFDAAQQHQLNGGEEDDDGQVASCCYRSPVTNEVLRSRALLPNYALRRLIAQHRTAMGQELLQEIVQDHMTLLPSRIDALVEAGADVNARLSGTGETALMLLAKQSKLALAIRLMEVHGADPSLVDDAGQSLVEGGDDDDEFLARVRISAIAAKQRRERKHSWSGGSGAGAATSTAATHAVHPLSRSSHSGFFPSLFGLQFQGALDGSNGNGGGELVLLSRCLLGLGSLLMLGLLLMV